MKGWIFPIAMGLSAMMVLWGIAGLRGASYWVALLFALFTYGVGRLRQ